MTLLDVMGKFWLAAKPDKKVPGRLTIDEENNAQLDLIDPLYALADTFNLDDQPVRILGTSSGKLLTLDRCFKTPLSGILNTYEKYSSSLVIEGAHFNENEVMEFNSLTLKPNYLEQWVWMTGVRVDGNNEDFTLKVSQNESMKQAIDGGEISLDFYAGYSGEVVGTKTITDGCTFRVKFHAHSPLERLFGTASSLQDLITLGVGRPASIVHADLRRDDMTNPCRLYAHWRARTDRNDSRMVTPHNMLFSFSDIGGIDGVSAWMKNAARFNSVIAPLRGYWYTSELDVETRLIVLYIAAESLDKVLTGFKKSDAYVRVKRLAEKAGNLLFPVTDINRWVGELNTARNEFVHHNSIFDPADPLDYIHLYFLEESLYFLIILCMLQACGIPEAALARVHQNPRFRSIMKHLRG